MKRSKRINSKPESIWNYSFISVCVITTLMNLSKQMSNSILSKYVDSFGASAAVVGLVSSVFALAALLFKVFSGPALDSFDKKKIIFAAMMVLAVAFGGYAIANNVSTIVVFRFLQGAAQAFTATCLLTMAADTLPRENFGAGVGVFALFETIASAIGPTVGLKLIGVIGYKNTFGVSSVCMFLSAFLVLLYKPAAPFVRRKKFHISWRNIIAPETLVFAVLLMTFNTVSCVVNTYLAIYSGMQGVSSNQIGYYFTLNAVVLLLSRPLVGKLTDKLGVVKVLIPALCCCLAAYWIISIATSIWMFLLAAFISAFGLGACQPAMQALCMKCVSSDKRGAASSTSYIAQDLGNLVGPMIAGIVVKYLGYQHMWRIMSLPALFGIVYILFIRKRIKKIEQKFVQSSTENVVVAHGA